MGRQLHSSLILCALISGVLTLSWAAAPGPAFGGSLIQNTKKKSRVIARSSRSKIKQHVWAAARKRSERARRFAHEKTVRELRAKKKHDNKSPLAKDEITFATNAREPARVKRGETPPRISSLNEEAVENDLSHETDRDEPWLEDQIEFETSEAQ